MGPCLKEPSKKAADSESVKLDQKLEIACNTFKKPQ